MGVLNLEFGEKLKQLRKSKGLTQEEFASDIFVSRTAVSKWESGRGYPSIDLLKVIAEFFSLTIDQLLSGEAILSIAKKENKESVNKICNFILGFVDLFAILLIVLPLYPIKVNGYIYSVNLFNFVGGISATLILHWALFIALILIGATKIILTFCKVEKGQKIILIISLLISSVLVLFLAVTREPYPLIIVFILLVGKGVIAIKLFK